MLSIDLSFVWAALNLAVLYILLKKFLFGRVGDFLDRRAAAVEADISAGKAARDEGDAYRAQHENMLNAAKTECVTLLESAKTSAQGEYDAIVADARLQASAIIEKARNEAAREAEKAYGEIKKQVAVLAIMAASKVIEANMDAAQNRVIAERFIDDNANGLGAKFE
jgi:F-type H+-transporting ATPase subunit b